MIVIAKISSDRGDYLQGSKSARKCIVVFALHFLVSGFAKQNMSPQYLYVKKPLKIKWRKKDGKNATVPVFNAMF